MHITKNLLAGIAISFCILGTTSCSKDEGGCPSGSENDSLTIALSSDTVELNRFNRVTIKVLDKGGNDITSTCKLFANNFPVIGTTYYPTKTGKILISATTDCQSSFQKYLEVVAPTNNLFSQKVFVEDLTGTWCGYCTRVHYNLDTFKLSNPNLVSITVHGGGSDPFQYTAYTSYQQKYASTGFPTVILNRIGKWNESSDSKNVALKDALKKYAPVGLSISSNIAADSGSISGTVKVKFAAGTDRPLKIVIMLVENNLIADQTNFYSNLYGGANPIKNFVHNGVLRKTSTNLFGDPIPTQSQTEGNEYSQNFSFTMTGKTYNGLSYKAKAANCGIVALVVDDAGTEGAYNVQYAEAGTTKDYD